jgi:hypothetical protein
MRSITLAMHEVRLISRNEDSSLAGFLAFRIGMMIAISHECGQSAEFHDRLVMRSSSFLPYSPSAFRKVGGMSSGPA